MKQLRKVIFWCHLLCGVIAGVIVLTMSVTGVILTYEKQIMAWADTRSYQVTVPPEAQRLPVETLVAKVQASQNAAPVAVTMRAENDAPAALAFNGGRTIYANPYTGEVFGEGAPGVRKFFRTVTDWHRWLGTEGAGRATGRAITGVCNLAFLFIVVSGFYLWFPRTLTWPQFKNVLWFRRRLPSKARDFNWHNVIGFWSLVPLFIIVLSGSVISYPWMSDLVYKVVGEAPPPRSAPPAQPANNNQPRTNQAEAPANPLAGIDALWARAEQQQAGWKSISLRLPTAAEAPLVFTIDRGTGGEPQKRSTLTLDRKTGDVAKWETFDSFTAGRQLRSFLRFAHTGEVAGLIGQTVAGVITLGAAVLVWTGLALALRRFLAWRSRRVRVSAEATEAIT